MPLRVKCNDLVRSESVKTVGVTSLVAKLDLESIIRKNLDDSPDLTRRKPKVRYVGNEGYRVEKLDG